MTKLSVIIPYVNEWPQVLFTIRSIAEELRDRVDFEILVVDNYCNEVKKQGKERDNSAKHFREVEKGQKWLRFFEYNEKLSHWNAKRIACEQAKGDILWFCDAHCSVGRDALHKMFKYYEENWKELNGSIHLPLTYSILEWRKLLYKPVINLREGVCHYSFTSYSHYEKHFSPFKVPCMSSCGMMIHKSFYDKVGGWPKELGIYGGGENFMNYTLAVLGMHKWIMPGEPLYHHGDKRGYSFNSADYLRNRCIATYLFGGESFMRLMMKHAKGRGQVKELIVQNVLSKCKEHRVKIANLTEYTIEEWCSNIDKMIL